MRKRCKSKPLRCKPTHDELLLSWQNSLIQFIRMHIKRRSEVFTMQQNTRLLKTYLFALY